VPDVATQRVLIHVPIVHTHADMGALGETIKHRLVEKFGENWWRNNVSAIDLVWDEIETSLRALDLPYHKVRIYQDGLPVCGREMDIVRELAAAGSRNHRLLLEMAGRGAVIMGTESAELLVEEYSRVRRLLQSSDFESKEEDFKTSGVSLIRKRDRFIAERIAATLASGEVGILFLGMLHSLADLLPEDLQVLNLLPFAASRARIVQALLAAKHRA